MKPNFLGILLAALIPMVIGIIWYNPKVFGNAWMKASGMDAEKAKGANMPLILGLSFLFSFFLAFALQFIVIHQSHIYSLLAGEPGINEAGSEVNNLLTSLIAKYGDRFRTFKHGALHGTIAGITLALPFIGTNALFERKGFKYIAINAGYWIVSLALMGGVVSALR